MKFYHHLSISIACLGFVFNSALAADTKEPQSGVHSSVNSEFYDINGDNSKALISEMRSKGPTSKEGMKFFALTLWNIHWQYKYEKRKNDFVISFVSLQVDINYNYPRWKNAEKQVGPLADEWKRFMAALVVHEEGHAKDAIEQSEKLYAKLTEARHFSSVIELQTYIETEGNKAIAEAKKFDIEYDKQTKHGFTQGVILH